MTYPKSMTPPNPHRVVSEAERLLWMPDANALTRELTAALLQSYGLLEVPATPGVPIHLARPIREAVRRRAETLCREVQALRARATVLCEEAEQLCKP
jgi:hypothetical protein